MRRPLLAFLALLPLAACVSGDLPTHVVFFTENSTTLDPAARAVVADAARSAARMPSARIGVYGYAGNRGPATFNDALSESRARTVAQVLRDNGVDPARIVVVPRGPTAAASPAAPTESRRVEIEIGI